MEDSITIEELFAFHRGIYRMEHRQNRFAAALKGIDLDEETEKEDTFERIQRKAQADLAGKTEDELVFDMLGIEIDDEEEVYD